MSEWKTAIKNTYKELMTHLYMEVSMGAEVRYRWTPEGFEVKWRDQDASATPNSPSSPALSAG